MSQENVESYRQSVDAFNRRDLDALLALMDPDVEAVALISVMEGSYRGHAGIRRWWGDMFELLPDYFVEVLEVREIGDLTLAALRNRAHGPRGGRPVEHTLWHVAEWHNGKVTWWTSHETEAEALEAVALRT